MGNLDHVSPFYLSVSVFQTSVKAPAQNVAAQPTAGTWSAKTGVVLGARIKVSFYD